MRIVVIAVVLAVAGLLVSASQIAPARAGTSHAAGGGGPKPTGCGCCQATGIAGGRCSR